MDPHHKLCETHNVQIQKSFFKKLNITVEPIFLTLFFCFSLTDAAQTNLILSRTCQIVFQFSAENCTGELTPFVDNTIQPYAAKLVMGISIIKAICPVLLSLFIGSWIDTSKRRKPFLILPLIGFTIEYMIWLIFVILPMSPMYFLFTALPLSLAGGFVSVFTCGYAYLTDVTTEETRAFRMSVCMILLSVGILFGYLVSSEIFKTFPTHVYLILYGIAIISLILTLFYTFFLLPETTPCTEVNANTEGGNNRDKGFFNVSHIKQSLNFLLKKRPANERIIIIFLIVIIVIDVLVFTGESNFRYLSLKASFSWSAEDYTVFSSVYSAAVCITGIMGIWLLNRVLGLTEPFIILLIVSLSCTSSILQSISKTPADFYCAALLDSLIAILSPLIKSEMSRLVSSSDIGKAFAFVSTLEAAVPFAATPAYTAVYDEFLPYKPLYIFFLSAIFWLVTVVLALVILLFNYIYGRNYQLLEEDPDREYDADHEEHTPLPSST